MRFAKIIDGVVVQYPISGTDVVMQNTDTSFPQGELSVELMQSFNCEPVVETAPATFDPITQNISDSVTLQDGQWVQTWVVTDASEIEVAEREQQRKDNNAARAKAMLLDTDWSENASVRNTAMTPHLVNGEDFDTYRITLRAIVIDRPVEVSQWPERPDAIWSTQAAQ